MEKEPGQVIAELRKKAGISQKDLAERVGLSPSALCQIEKRGIKNPKIERLTQIFYEIKAPIGYALWKAGFPVYKDNPGTCFPPMVEICEIIDSLPEGPKRDRVEQILLEMARTLQDHTE